MTDPVDSTRESLAAALEVVTAFTATDADPEFFWQRLAAVLDDRSAGRDASWAQAELLYGLTQLAGTLTAQLAAERGSGPGDVLARVAAASLAR